MLFNLTLALLTFVVCNVKILRIDTNVIFKNDIMLLFIEKAEEISEKTKEKQWFRFR